jgi:hypothetical protein
MSGDKTGTSICDVFNLTAANITNEDIWKNPPVSNNLWIWDEPILKNV